MQSGGSGPGVDSEEPDGMGTAYAKALRLESAHLRSDSYYQSFGLGCSMCWRYK